MGRTLPILLIGLGTALGVHAEAAKDAATDFWNGKSRAEIVSLLGDPTKAKTSTDGSELLTYKLVRLREGSVAPPGVMVMSVPEVGLVGRVLVRERSESVSIEPSAIDEDGRLVPGGETTTQTAGAKWSSEEGLEQHPGAEGGDAIVGNVKLKFQLDATGRVVEWSQAPKRRPE